MKNRSIDDASYKLHREQHLYKLNHWRCHDSWPTRGGWNSKQHASQHDLSTTELPSVTRTEKKNKILISQMIKCRRN